MYIFVELLQVTYCYEVTTKKILKMDSKGKKKINRAIEEKVKVNTNRSFRLSNDNRIFVNDLVKTNDESDSVNRRLNQCVRFARMNDKLFREFLISEA